MIVEMIQNHPWIGMGFGVPFLPRIWMSEHGTATEQYPLPNVDPHNSHLSVLYRTGFIGLGLYLMFFISLILRALQVIANDHYSQKQRQLTLICVAYVVLCLVHASFAVVFEGPYMGIPFWVTVGLTLAATSIPIPNTSSENEKIYANRD
jgi:O-antigen ligase